MNHKHVAHLLRQLANEFDSEPVADDLDVSTNETDEPPEDGVTLHELQELGVRLIEAGKRKDLVRVLKEWEVKNLSSVPPDFYTEVYQDLKKELPE